MPLPFSQACENNQEPIRQVLEQYLTSPVHLLEIGSGTGQHGAYITGKHPELVWYPSDRKENLAGISAWVAHSRHANFQAPIELDVNAAHWPHDPVDMVFSANTAHIMHWQEVQQMFRFVSLVLKAQGHFFLYGPFNYNGTFTSNGNAQFHDWLQSQAPHRGIRDFEKVNGLAMASGLTLIHDHPMPASNRMLVWQQTGFEISR